MLNRAYISSLDKKRPCMSCYLCFLDLPCLACWRCNASKCLSFFALYVSICTSDTCLVIYETESLFVKAALACIHVLLLHAPWSSKYSDNVIYNYVYKGSGAFKKNFWY